LVAGHVIEDAVRDDGKVFGEVQRSGDYEQREQEEQNRVYSFELAA
jgi:hypothetical protein